MSDEGASWIKNKSFWTLLIVLIIAGTILRSFVPGIAEVVGLEITQMVNTIFGALAGIFFLLGFMSYEKSSKELFVETVIPILLFVAILSQSFGVDMGLTVSWVIIIMVLMAIGNFANKYIKHRGKEIGGALGAGISGAVGGGEKDWEDDEVYSEWRDFRKKLLKQRDKTEELLKELEEAVKDWKAEGDVEEKKKKKEKVDDLKRKAQSAIADLDYMKDKVKDIFKKDKKVKDVKKKLEDFEKQLEKLKEKIEEE